MLNGAYSVEVKVAYGGFGIVHKARHREIGLQIAITKPPPIQFPVREKHTVHARVAGCQEHSLTACGVQLQSETDRQFDKVTKSLLVLRIGVFSLA